jgi:hypothetical protein
MVNYPLIIRQTHTKHIQRDATQVHGNKTQPHVAQLLTLFRGCIITRLVVYQAISFVFEQKRLLLLYQLSFTTEVGRIYTQGDHKSKYNLKGFNFLFRPHTAKLTA